MRAEHLRATRRRDIGDRLCCAALIATVMAGVLLLMPLLAHLAVLHP